MMSSRARTMRSVALLLLAAPAAAAFQSYVPIKPRSHYAATGVAVSSSPYGERRGSSPRVVMTKGADEEQSQPAVRPSLATEDPKRKEAGGPLSGLRALMQGSGNAMQKALFTLLALGPLGAVLTTGGEAANAVPSGGRAGGSSFRSRSYSAPSTRRYATPPSSSYGGGDAYSSRPYSRGYIERVPIPVPVMPYYGGYGGFGYGVVRPFGFMSGITDFIIVGGVIYLIASVLKSAGGSNWDVDEGAPSSLGSGVTVLKLQVGIQVPDRNSPSTILGQLDDLAKTADVSNRQGLAQLVSATCLALLRTSSDWVSAHGESRGFNERQGNAESEYSRLAVRERSKFEREENAMERKAASQGPAPYFIEDSNRPTLAVVTVCVAIRGQSTKIGTVNSVPTLKAALQNLAADAMTDEGDNVLACEVLWTPQNPTDVLSKRDLITDYPELRDI